MSDLQSKLGGGLNMIQGSLQQGKQKIQHAQEINQYNKIITEGLEKRTEIILKIGEEVYKRLRSGDLQDESLGELAQEIIFLDQKVFQARKMVEKINESSKQDHTCPNCQGKLAPEDKFCGSCGYKVQETQKYEEIELVACSHCQEKVPGNAFCSCCGNRL